MNTAPTAAPGKQGLLDGFLTTIERVGNKVPHPAIIFFWLIGLVVVLSVILVGWSATYEAVDPVTGDYNTVVLLVLWTLLLIAWYLPGLPLGPA